jgi:hypothetical protein
MLLRGLSSADPGVSVAISWSCAFGLALGMLAAYRSPVDRRACVMATSVPVVFIATRVRMFVG